MRSESVAIRCSPWRSSPIIAALCGLLLCGPLLSGCSALRIAYSTAPDLVYWWLDGYIDFTDAQTPRVREAINQWFGWNRRTQLPDYATLLARAQVEVLADTTPARACAWQADLTKRARAAFEQIAPAAADVVLTITPDQVQHLERRYAKFNDEFRDDYLQPDPGKRAQATLKRTVDRAEELYGNLSDSQVAMLADTLPRSPFNAELWFAERQQRQQAVLQLLRRARSENWTKDQALAALRTYADQLEKSPRADYRRYSEALADFNCNFAAKVQNSTTPSQRKTASGKLAGWADDMRALANAPEPRKRDVAP